MKKKEFTTEIAENTEIIATKKHKKRRNLTTNKQELSQNI